MAVSVLVEKSSAYSPLGWHIRELMNRKRVNGQAELASIISENGYVITQPAISKIIRGKQDANQMFVSALARGLKLTEQERRELADVFAYGERDDAELTEGEQRSVDDFESDLDN